MAKSCIRSMNLSVDKLEDIIALIKGSIPFLYRLVIKDDCILEELILSEKSSFSYKNIYVIETNSKLVGLILIYSGEQRRYFIDKKIYRRNLKLLEYIRFILKYKFVLQNFITPYFPKKGIYIRSISIDANYRNKHFGYRLIEFIKAKLDNKKYTSIYIDMEKENTLGMSFIENLGFKKIRERKIMVEGSKSIVTFRFKI